MNGSSLSRRQMTALLGTSLCCAATSVPDTRPNPLTLAIGDYLGEVQSNGTSLLTETRLNSLGGAPIMCWPVAPDTGQPRKETSFNRIWVLKTGDQIKGYSVICQHAGCLVSDWDAKRHLLICPCHGSAYDVDHDGQVMEGPAPLPLPHLPIRIEKDRLRIAGLFSGHVGSHASRAD
ncbi:ubiquinol-cytochrome c reductase iron-sulfur subunit [Acetobacter sp.]|uniref:QcrA and Rieske domain-containing protein n=1 Tax=Acetobacter sp. TaxID=440 RepID=UPI0039EB8C51